MASLIETNPYLRDPETRQQMLEENAYQSSVFEGAQGLKLSATVRKKKTTPTNIKAAPIQSHE